MELVALIAFVAVPSALGYVLGRDWASLLPTAVLIAVVVEYARNPPTGNDEVDVLPALWIVLSAFAAVICIAAVWARRRRDRLGGSRETAGETREQ